MTEKSVEHKTFVAIVWMFIANSWTSLASFAVFALLARLLDPATFGTYTLAQAFLQIAVVVVTAAFNDAVIQRKEGVEVYANSAFWATAALGLGLLVLLLAGAGLYADAVNVPDVAYVLRLLAPCLFLESLAVVHMALKYREFGHRVVAFRTVAASIIGGGVAVIAAYYGAGIWSLVLQSWISSVLTVIFAWTSMRWVPKVEFSWAAIKDSLPFCGSILITRILWMLVARLPELFIGRALGAIAVSQYRIGYRLIEMMGQMVLGPMGTVALPSLSHEAHDEARFSAAYFRLLKLGALIAFPLLFGVGALSDTFVRLLFGSQWDASAPIVRIFSLMAVPLVFSFLVGQAMTAKGSGRNLSHLAFIQVATVLAVSWLCAPWGLAVVSAAFVVRSFLIILYQQVLLKRTAAIGFVDCLRAVQYPLLMAVTMGGVLLGVGPFVRGLLPQDIFFAAAMVSLGGVIYLSGIMYFEWPMVERTVAKLRSHFKGEGHAGI